MAGVRPATLTSSSPSGPREKALGAQHDVNPHTPKHGLDEAATVEANAPRTSADARHERLLELSRGAVWTLELDHGPRLDDPPTRIADAILNRGRITECNAAFADRFSVARDATIGGVTTDHLVGFWLTDDPHRLEGLAEGGLECRGLAVTELAADGAPRHLRVDMSPLVEHGRLAGLLAVETEIAAEGGSHTVPNSAPEAALAERTEQERQQAFTHVSRLSTLGEMASGIAHEFNQPLAAIVNYANGCMRLLEQRGVDDQMVFRALGSIVDQGQRASGIIRRLRSFARRGEGDRESLRMADILEESIQLMAEPSRRARVQIVTDFAAADDVVIVDGIQIQQVVINLLLNAIEALGATDEEHERRIRVSTLLVGNPGSSSGVRTVERLTAEGPQAYVETIVEDNGPGVRGEVSHRLFDPFYSASGKGLGLGLPIGRSIVESHGGRLWLGPTMESSPDPAGARFRFTLPLGRGQMTS